VPRPGAAPRRGEAKEIGGFGLFWLGIAFPTSSSLGLRARGARRRNGARRRCHPP